MIKGYGTVVVRGIGVITTRHTADDGLQCNFQVLSGLNWLVCRYQKVNWDQGCHLHTDITSESKCLQWGTGKAGPGRPNL